ncbi:MAG: class beta-lactamase [Ramlibacter sp.]|nr:class beta-lactamase [Ramlibacter sp.]
MLGALASTVSPAFAQPDARHLSTTVGNAIRPLMAKHDVPGMAVGLTLAGRQHTFQFGVASREPGAAVTAETLFEVGSVSKTFTATLAAYAQSLGKLSLTDSPGRTLPALRGCAIDAASLLHLATYTAGGLPLQFPDDIADEAAALRFYRAWRPAARPGQQRRYSNPSIGLLGYITGLAMQRNFSELAERELFPALGLQRTFIRVPASHMGAYAWGYDKDNRPIRVNPGVFDALAYGVKSTAADLLTFLEANIDPSRLEPAMRSAVEATHAGHFRVGPMVQGLGWEQYPFPVSLEHLQAGNASSMLLQPNAAHALARADAPHGPALFNKTGSTNGFGAYAAFVPSRRVGIVLLANKNVPIPARIEAAYAVLREVAPG